MPTPDERRTLHIAQGVPVLTVSRRMLADSKPVEAALDIVMPGDRFILDYDIDLPALDAPPPEQDWTGSTVGSAVCRIWLYGIKGAG
jgi:hypothetical protein